MKNWDVKFNVNTKFLWRKNIWLTKNNIILKIIIKCSIIKSWLINWFSYTSLWHRICRSYASVSTEFYIRENPSRNKNSYFSSFARCISKLLRDSFDAIDLMSFFFCCLLIFYFVFSNSRWFHENVYELI